MSARHEALLERVRRGDLAHSAFWSTFRVPPPARTEKPVDFAALGRMYDRRAVDQLSVSEDETRTPYERGRARREATTLTRQALRCFQIAREMEVFP